MHAAEVAWPGRVAVELGQGWWLDRQPRSGAITEAPAASYALRAVVVDSGGGNLRSGRVSNGSLPAKEEDMVATQRAAMRKEEPEEGPLQEIPRIDASEFDRPAMRTAQRGQAEDDAGHMISFLLPWWGRREARRRAGQAECDGR